MSTEPNSSMQMASDNVPINYHRPPTISEETQRELIASAERFMRSRSQQDNASEKSSKSGSNTTHSAKVNVNAKSSSNSNSNVNANSNSNSNSSSAFDHPHLPDNNVETKLPETNLKSDDKSEDNVAG